MNIVLPFLITIAIGAFMGLGGYYVYRFMNNKITSSQRGWELFFYSVLLFIALGIIYLGGLFIMAYIFFSLTG